MRKGVRERRTACRYPAVNGKASLGWWEGSEFGTAPAVIRNISLAGGLVEAKAPIKVGSRVWVRLQGAISPQWVEGTVVQRERVGWKTHLFRVRFTGQPVYHLFDAALLSL